MQARQGQAQFSAPRTFTSKTAYMLCYTRSRRCSGSSRPAPLEAPECLRAPIDEENAKLQAEVEAHAAAAASLQEGRAARDALCEELEPLLGQPAAAGDGRWVSEQSLERCLTLPPSEAGGIDNAPLVCEHGKASPQALGKMRLVSSDAWAVLCRRVGGGPELRDHGCLACVGVQSQEQQRRKPEERARRRLAAAAAAAAAFTCRGRSRSAGASCWTAASTT